MIEDFVERFARMLATYPEEIRVDRRDVDESFSELVIYAHKSDAGKLIGKDGNMINALKTVISGCKAKDGIAYRVLVRPGDEAPY